LTYADISIEWEHNQQHSLKGNDMNSFTNEFSPEESVEYQEYVDATDWHDEDDEDDGQPTEYDEWQDYMGGDDWDQGQYDCEE